LSVKAAAYLEGQDYKLRVFGGRKQWSNIL